MIKKRILTLLLILSLLPWMPALPVRADETELTFGEICIFAPYADKVQNYPAALGANGTVLIEANAFADMLGAEILFSGDTVAITQNFRTVSVDAEENTAEYYYFLNPKSGQEYYISDKFVLPECLCITEKGSWYLPLEHMLYLFGCEWACQNRTVIVYQPETLLDLVAKSRDMYRDNPELSSLYGENRWISATGFGFWAVMDELDMTLFSDTLLATLGVKDQTGLEQTKMQEALLTLLSDTAQDAVPEDYVTDAEGALSHLLSYFDIITGFDDSTAAREVFWFLTGRPQYFSDITFAGNTSALTNDLLPHAVYAAKAYQLQQQIPENFNERLQRIMKIKASAGTEDAAIYNAFADSASQVYDMCHEDLLTVLKDSMTLDDYASLYDDTTQLFGSDIVETDGVLWTLQLMSAYLDRYQFAVDTAALHIPEFKSMLDDADNALRCKDLILLENIMHLEYSRACCQLTSGKPISQKMLDDIRLTAEIMECSALHAKEILQALGEIEDDSTYYPQTSYLIKLADTEAYDKLLMLQPDFSDLYNEESGCLRVQIPEEYVHTQNVTVSSFIGEYNGIVYCCQHQVPGMPMLPLPAGAQPVQGGADGLYTMAGSDEYWQICGFAFYHDKLYYACKTGGTSEISANIYVSDPDGSNPEQLIHAPVSYTQSSDPIGEDCLNFIISDDILYYGQQGQYALDLKTRTPLNVNPDSDDGIMARSFLYYDWENNNAPDYLSTRYDGDARFRLENKRITVQESDGTTYEIPYLLQTDYYHLIAVTSDAIYYSDYTEDFTGRLFCIDRESGECTLIDQHPAAGGGDYYFNW